MADKRVRFADFELDFGHFQLYRAEYKFAWKVCPCNC